MSTPWLRTARSFILSGMLLCLSLQTGRLSLADEVALIPSGRDAAAVRYDMIERAQKEIIFSALILEDELAGRAFLAKLLEAHQKRGVQVKIVVDGVMSHISRGFLAEMQRAGLEIKLYHPLRWRNPIQSLRWLNQRMHDKIFIIDGKEMISGGRNAGGNYFGFGGKRQKLDREAIIRDSAEIQEARSYAMRLWNSDEVVAVKPSSSGPAAQARFNTLVSRYLGIANQVGRNRLSSSGEFDFMNIEPGKIEFVYDDVGRENKAVPIADKIVELIDSAEKGERITIETPYLAPTPEQKAAMIRAIRKGAEIEIYTNSIKSTDVQSTQALYEREKEWYRKIGIRVFERAAPESMHGKSIVVGDRKAYVGSFNMNRRSSNSDTETGVIINDAEFARRTRQLIYADHALVSIEAQPADQNPFGQCEIHFKILSIITPGLL